MFDFDSLKKERALVMGIINVTPDSFSDGGDSYFAEAAFQNALRMQSEGADIIDIGGCSTAPSNKPASLQEELARLATVFPLLPDNLSVPVSVDTFRPEAARFALEHGAVIINDESGVFDPAMASLVKEFGAGWVVMHTGAKESESAGGYIGRVAAGAASFLAVTGIRGRAFASQMEEEYPEGVTADVLAFFKKMRKKALDFGINEKQLCYDYGIGFGKTREDDAALLRQTALFSDYKPLLVGVSRKRIIGAATLRSVPAERVAGSVAAEAVAAYFGADIIRVHDVAEAVDAANVAAYIKGRD